MSIFDFDSYASAINIIASSPEKMRQSLVQLEQNWEAQKAKEEAHTQSLLSQLAQKKTKCTKQYDEIRTVCESIGIYTLPPQQRPIPSQLYVDDALVAQNNLAKEIKTMIDDYYREQNQAKQKRRAQEKEEAIAREKEREKAAIEAKKKKEEEEKAKQEENLRILLESERERQNKEELLRKLKHLIPAGIVIIVILLILILK